MHRVSCWHLETSEWDHKCPGGDLVISWVITLIVTHIRWRLVTSWYIECWHRDNYPVSQHLSHHQMPAPGSPQWRNNLSEAWVWGMEYSTAKNNLARPVARDTRGCCLVTTSRASSGSPEPVEWSPGWPGQCRPETSADVRPGVRPGVSLPNARLSARSVAVCPWSRSVVKDPAPAPHPWTWDLQLRKVRETENIKEEKNISKTYGNK